jgi:hypothetical protein
MFFEAIITGEMPAKSDENSMVQSIPDDVTGPDRTFRQMFNPYFASEFERRQWA